MSSTNEVKRESEGKLAEASANEKFLYSRVLELEKRNQKLEKKVKKLKKKKKELKEEVAKLRGAVPVQHMADGHDDSTSDVEVVEEPNFGLSQSNLNEEQVVNSDINSNKETATQSNGGAQVEENRGWVIEEAAEEMEADNYEELDEEAVDNPSGSESSEVSNQCLQCSKGFSTPGNLSLHIRGVHGPKKECSYCHKMFNSTCINLHIRETHMGDTRECPECKKQIRSSKFSQHMQVVHSGIKEECPRCGDKFSIYSLKKHIKGVHDNVRKPCPLCPKMFSATSLKRHITEVHHVFKVKCPSCSKHLNSS